MPWTRPVDHILLFTRTRLEVCRYEYNTIQYNTVYSGDHGAITGTLKKQCCTGSDFERAASQLTTNTGRRHVVSFTRQGAVQSRYVSIEGGGSVLPVLRAKN
jgi:hypothetical protein